MRVLPAAPVLGQACARGVSSSRHKRSPLSARCDIARADGVRTEHPWKPPRKLHSSFSSGSPGESFFERARRFASAGRCDLFRRNASPTCIASGVTGFIRGKANSGMGFAGLKAYDGIQDCANDAASRFLSRR